MKPVKSVTGWDRLKRAVKYAFGADDFYHGGHSDQRRLPIIKLDRDILTMMSERRQRMMISDGRYIYGSFPLVSGCVDQKSDYVYGSSWQLQSYSEDDDFRRAVMEDFKNIESQLDKRGGAFGFRRNVKLLSKALEVEGDTFVLLTEERNTGFPKLQYMEAHTVGNWANERDEVVRAGSYRGRRILSGVIYDDYSMPIAYRFKDEGSRVGYRDIGVSAVVPVVDMRYFSQGRGKPTICAALYDWYDLSETKDAQKVKQKNTSMLNLIESNETGAIDVGNLTVNPRPAMGGDLQTEIYDAGAIRYIRNGASLQTHTADDPSGGWLEFTKTVQQQAIFAMRWRREMFDAEQMARAAARGVVNDINRSITDRCEVLTPAMKRIALYVIAKRAKMGAYELPEDWFKIGFTKPAEFRVDEVNLRKADIEDLRAGLSDERSLVEKRGEDYDALLLRRAVDIKKKKEVARLAGLEPWELGSLLRPGEIPDPGGE